MIKLLFNLAREHKAVKAFRYARGGGKGSGVDAYPIVWVDDAVIRRKASNGVDNVTINFDVLLTVKRGQNKLQTDFNVEDAQAKAYLIGRSFIQKIDDTYKHTIQSYQSLSLSQYTDDDAAGQRFTITVTDTVPLDLCAEFYDPDKEIDTTSPLPEYSTEGAKGCIVFNKEGLPDYE